MTSLKAALAAALTAMLAGTACSGSRSNPASPSGSTSTPSTQSCRTFASGEAVSSTSESYSANATSTCSYNTSSNEVTCVYRYVDSNGALSESTIVTAYASVGDFVAEVNGNPLATSSTSGDSIVSALITTTATERICSSATQGPSLSPRRSPTSGNSAGNQRAVPRLLSRDVPTGFGRRPPLE